MNRKVFIRVDSNSEIGLGHIVRCISLAHMLANDFFISFFTNEIPINLRNEIIKNRWKLTFIERESDFINLLSGNEIVILDGYHFDSEYQKKIKSKACKLVYIDDMNNQHYYADIVINHAPGLSKDKYLGEPYTKYLLGPKYALIRPEFIPNRITNVKHRTNSSPRLFICFGGSDVKNLSSLVISHLPFKAYCVTVVHGSTYSHQFELNEVIKRRSDLKVIVKSSLNAKEMKMELSKADLAIIPASGILFEVISQRIPAISGYYVENQKMIYEGFKDTGVFIDAKDFSSECLTSAIKSIEPMTLDCMIEKQLDFIDGMSMDRIKEELCNL